MDGFGFTVKEVTSSLDYGEFVIEPLETGYGHTIGNALRRVLYTSIPGAAITSLRIVGVKHKFSTFPGLKENIVDLLLNLKNLNLKLSSNKPSATIKLNVKGAKEVTAKDLEVSDGVEIINQDQYICSLSGSQTKLEMELTIESGLGFSLAEDRKVSTLEYINTDAVFSPIRRVTYDVAATRVGRQTNLDKLTLKIWTNGTILPKDALMHAAKILTNSFAQIHSPKEGQIDGVTQSANPTVKLPEVVLKLTIDELDLPTRIYNSLRNGGIETIEQLLSIPKKDLVALRNMGSKSVSTIEEKLQEKGISLTI